MDLMDKKEILKKLNEGIIIVLKQYKGEEFLVKFEEVKRTRFSAISSKDGVSYSYPLEWFQRVANDNEIEKYNNTINNLKLKFVEKNTNPKNNRIEDCVVRAISVATEISWETVLMDLTKIGVGKGMLFNYMETYEEYLIKLGFKEITTKDLKVTIKDFVENKNKAD